LSGDDSVLAGAGTAAEIAAAIASSSPETSRSRTLVWQDPVATATAGATMSGMDYMTAIVGGAMPPPPIAVTMRLRPIELEEGRVVFEGEPGEEHYSPIGVVHGGCAATVLYRGRKQATAEARLTAAAADKLLAHGVSTCMILGG
jgi:acyl-coenzyme A thioesterase PaaI-like protein